MKNIALLILSMVLAIALTAIAVYLLWLEFHDYEWGHGFVEVLFSLIAAVFGLICNINILVYIACAATWNGVAFMWKKVFGKKVNSRASHYAYRKKQHNHSSNMSDDYFNIHGSNEDNSYLYED